MVIIFFTARLFDCGANVQSKLSSANLIQYFVFLAKIFKYRRIDGFARNLRLLSKTQKASNVLQNPEKLWNEIDTLYYFYPIHTITRLTATEKFYYTYLRFHIFFS